MDARVEVFLTILAWPTAILHTLVVIHRWIGAATYSDLDAIRDARKGQEQTFPVAMPALIACICWAWIWA